MSCWRALLRLLTANAQQLTETHLAPLWAGLEASLVFAAAYPSSQAGAMIVAFATKSTHVNPTSTWARIDRLSVLCLALMEVCHHTTHK